MKSIQRCGSITTLWATLIAEELVRLGVKHVCIAPGSRNTPLVAAIAKQPGLEKVVCQDERSAAFFALGCAKAAGNPAVVVCTSGSAVANLWPAVVEAAADCNPLLVFTADRPPELRGVGANQTIDQTKIFGGYSSFYVDMPVPDERIPLRFVLSTIDEAHRRSKNGPSHLNFMFREPFEPDAVDNWNHAILDSITQWLQDNDTLVRFLPSQLKGEVAEVAHLMRHSESGVIVAGALNDRDAEQAVLRLAEKIGWPLIADVLSNLRFTASSSIVTYADLALLDTKMPVPDVVLQFGGRLVSKRIQQFLDKGHSRAHLFVDHRERRLDPGCVVTHRLCTQVDQFADDLASSLQTRPQQTESYWSKVSRNIAKALLECDIEKELSEISVARSLLESLDESQFIFCGSSMPIRDVNMFAKPCSRPPRLFANRGSSGIDGVVSTACGVAKALSSRGVLLCGDLTFLHDANGLQLMKSLDKPLAIIVVNNRGGGIFTMLDIHREQEIFTPYFDAEHDVDVSGLCKAHSIRFERIDTLPAWSSMLREIPNLTMHVVIEVVSNKWDNKRLHDEIRDCIKRKLSV